MLAIQRIWHLIRRSIVYDNCLPPVVCGALAVVIGTLGVVSCDPHGKLPTSAPVASQQPTVDVGPAGDIPDNQAFVTFTAPDRTYSVKVPEGWSRTDTSGVVQFTDKLNTITLTVRPSVIAPTEDSVKVIDERRQQGQRELDAIATSASGFHPGDVSLVDRPAGQVILLTYGADSPPSPVTGKVVAQAVQRYEFYRPGVQVTITLSAPDGADNVDPWRTVTDSFAWLP
jgi:hypothetical protein